MNDKVLFIIRGVSGSGKTTFAHTICDTVFSADDYHMVNGEYVWKQENIGRAHEACYNNTKKAMIDGVSRIAVANTNTREREIRPYIELAREFGYTFFSIIVENRNDTTNVHNVPEETLVAQERRFDIKLR